jgi:UDP-3-O-[3-hydroxymyristoyl] glucosamine N-acyltransferase
MRTQLIEISTILDLLNEQVVRVVGSTEHAISYPAPISEAEDECAITFCAISGVDALSIITATRAGVVLCKEEPLLDIWQGNKKTIIFVKNPRLAFIHLVRNFFAEVITYGIDPHASVDPESTILQPIRIGPYSIVGKCSIGEGTIISAHVYIHSNTRIGRNVVIDTGTVIGGEGFGFERNESGILERFPHIGGVDIGSDVEIGANSCIDRGTLGNTIIGEGTKINNLVHIAHNAKIGQHVVIAAQVNISGSTTIDDYAWIGPGATLRDGIRVGAHSTIGMGSVVVGDVAPGTTVYGVPARAR